MSFAGAPSADQPLPRATRRWRPPRASSGSHLANHPAQRCRTARGIERHPEHFPELRAHHRVGRFALYGDQRWFWSCPTCTAVGAIAASADGLSSAHVHSVLIIDRLPLFAEAMRAALEASLEFRVAGCPLSLEEAFSLGNHFTPDLINVDCRVSDCDGAQAV